MQQSQSFLACLFSPHKLSSMHFIVISFGVCGMHFWKRRFGNIANINKPFHYWNGWRKKAAFVLRDLTRFEHLLKTYRVYPLYPSRCLVNLLTSIKLKIKTNNNGEFEDVGLNILPPEFTPGSHWMVDQKMHP